MRYSRLKLTDNFADQTHALCVISSTLSQRIVDDEPDDMARDVYEILTEFDVQLAKVIEIRAKVKQELGA
jgi:hypothetical protein